MFPEFVVICQSLGVVCTEAGVLILGEFTVNTDFRAVEGIVIVVIKRAAPVYGGCGVELVLDQAIANAQAVIQNGGNQQEINDANMALINSIISLENK